jgi:drug/metabolite transporter (DMT)-like permease
LNSLAAQTHRPPRWVPDFIALAAIWGASFLFTRWSMLGFGPVVTAALRVIIASAVLLPLMLLRGHRADFALHWKKVLLVGVINSAIPFVCIAFALQSISIGQSSVLNATVPLFGALIAWAWLGDRPSGSSVVGLLIGFTGIALLASENASFDTNALGSSSAWGIAASLLACLCYGIAASYTRRFLGGVPSLVSATGSQMGASIFLLPFYLWYWPAQAPSAQAWLAVSALGVLCTGTAYILYFRLIANAGPTRALTVTFAIPVFAIAYGVILLGEGVTHWMLGCAVVIVLGTSLSSGLWSLRFSKPRMAD